LKEICMHISFKKVMAKQEKSVDKRIVNRIYGKKRGWVFTPGSFKDLGSRSAIDLALMRYKGKGTIRKLARGLYDYPRMDPVLGTMPPSTDDIARALAGRDATKIQPSGAHAANLLGLTTQVPVKVVYLTDGRSRAVQVGNRQIVLQHREPKSLATAGKISGLVIQALKYLGQEHIDDQVIKQLNRRLSKGEREQLLKDVRHAPEWIAQIFRKLGGATL
jgi:hypothetical protein